jgi:hypothetical protein
MWRQFDESYAGGAVISFEHVGVVARVAAQERVDIAQNLNLNAKDTVPKSFQNVHEVPHFYLTCWISGLIPARDVKSVFLDDLVAASKRVAKI